MGGFQVQLDAVSWYEMAAAIKAKTEADVAQAIGRPQRNYQDFLALVSPAADRFLTPMTEASRRLTLERFGNTIRLYIPLYLSNFCTNICTYCGFRHDHQVPRKLLTLQEVEAEAKAIAAMGMQNLLLVTGEDQRQAGMDYFLQVMDLLRSSFASLSLEIQPLEVAEYQALVDRGLYGVYCYQETYWRQYYRQYHPKGKKCHFDHRLATAERMAKAGVRKIGLGFLLGLENWRVEAAFMALHLSFLEKHYWRAHYGVSFPRLRDIPGSGTIAPENPVHDDALAQMICAFRLVFPAVDLTLSTREPAALRDRLMTTGITTMSAGSLTNPGGYAQEHQGQAQFSIEDHRTPAQVAAAIEAKGYQPVWKDWQRCTAVS